MRNMMPRLVQIVTEKQYEAAYGKSYASASTLQDIANKQAQLAISKKVRHVIGLPSDISAAG